MEIVRNVANRSDLSSIFVALEWISKPVPHRDQPLCQIVCAENATFKWPILAIIKES